MSAIKTNARRVETQALDRRIALVPIPPETLTGSPNSFALGVAQTAEPRGPGPRAARANLDDEHELRPAGHDVELEPTQAQVTADDDAAGRLQIASDRVLGALTEPGASRTPVAHSPPPILSGG